MAITLQNETILGSADTTTAVQAGNLYYVEITVTESADPAISVGQKVYALDVDMVDQNTLDGTLAPNTHYVVHSSKVLLSIS